MGQHSFINPVHPLCLHKLSSPIGHRTLTMGKTLIELSNISDSSVFLVNSTLSMAYSVDIAALICSAICEFVLSLAVFLTVLEAALIDPLRLPQETCIKSFLPLPWN